MQSAIGDQRYESLFAELLRRAPKYSKDDISKLIEEKKSKVGGGYLTDKGALFLLASDLGITLSSSADSNRLSDIDKGASDLTLSARILSMSQPRTFSKKGGSGIGLLVKLVLYDESGYATLNLWNKNPLEFFDSIRPGDLVQVSHAYSKPNLDGSISLNIDDTGSIERTSEGNSNIPPLEKKIVLPSSISRDSRWLAVRAIVEEPPRRTEFNRKDGNQGVLTSLAITGEKGDSSTRVVIWQNQNPSLLNLRSGETVTLLNLRVRVSNFAQSETIELHGDETTCLLEYWEETRHWMKKDIQSIQLNSKDSALDRKVPQNPLPFVARVLSAGDGSVESVSHILLVDSQNRKFSLALTSEALTDIQNIGVDDVVICKPDSIDQMNLKASSSKKGSLVRSVAKRPDIPDSRSLFKTIENLEPNNIVSLEAMTLSNSACREITTTKDGLVRRCEVVVGDPTGEIKIFGWRSLSKRLENISAGEKIKLHSIEVQSHEGKKFLVLKNYSKIERT